MSKALREFFFKGIACLALCSIAGCSLLPGKAPQQADGAPGEAAPAAQTQPGDSEQSEEQTAKRKKLRWQDILFFWWPKRKPGPPVAAPLQTAGVVSFVNLPGNFVILETAMATSLPVGQELSAIKDGRIASRVKVTADRRPPFVIAEIVEGTPERGDSFHPVLLD